MGLEAVVIRANPVLDWEQFSLTLDRSEIMEPRLSHREVGGFWDASFQVIPGLITRPFVSDILTNGIMRQVEFYNHKGKIMWEGFLATPEFSTGFVSMKADWRNLVNQTYAIFQTGGTRTRSTTKSYQPSIDRFGIKEQVHTLGQVGATQANQAMETFLRRSRWPSPTVSEINLGGGPTGQSLTIGCLGYWHTLKGRIYNQTSLTGDEDASVIVEAVVDAVGQFVQRKEIETNVTQLQQNVDADRTGHEFIEAIASFGDAATRRWVPGFREFGTFYYEQAAREN